jgi:magnesium-transporting ATPase (P-type)
MVMSPHGPVTEASPRDSRTGAAGLSSGEAAHRLAVDGRNELVSHRRSSLPGEIVGQLTHPLALLLWVAAALAWPTSGSTLAIVIVGVILLNAAFAVLQERQAVRAVEALRSYMPARSTVIRDGRRQQVDARTLVPGAPRGVRDDTATAPGVAARAPFPVIVWGVDELRRLRLRRRLDVGPRSV